MNRSDLVSFANPPGNLKMYPEHYQRLRAACATVLDNSPDARERYLARSIPNGDRVTNVNTRLRWDVYGVAVARAQPGLQGELYAYLNDSHIETALKHIIPDIE